MNDGKSSEIPISAKELKLSEKKHHFFGPGTFQTATLKESAIGFLREPIAIDSFHVILNLGYMFGSAAVSEALGIPGPLAAATTMVALRHVVTRSDAYKPLIKYSRPEIFKKRKTTSEIVDILGDEVNAFVPRGTRSKPYSLIPYKLDMVRSLARWTLKTPEESKWLVKFFLKASDPILKKGIINIISKYGKNGLLNYVTKFSKTDLSQMGLEGAVYARLASDWEIPQSQANIDHVKQLENLDIDHIYQTANDISSQVIEDLRSEIKLLETLDPFVKLYTLRRLKEEIANNNLPENTTLKIKFKKELIAQLNRFSRVERESMYDPESPTIGLEFQPQANRQREEGLPLKIDFPEIKKLGKFLGLEKSPDLPFELVLPPTRSPISQLLIFKEVLNITGAPIDSADTQINFGGIGRNKPLIKALQRMILMGGRLSGREETISKRGAYWDLHSTEKGEVNIREKGKFTGEPIRIITPKDQAYPELHEVVGEMRKGFDSSSFYIFARGLVFAHRLATLLKAKDRQLLNHSLSDREQSMVLLWDETINGLNSHLKQYKLPTITEDWRKKDWREFALTILNNRKKFKPKVKSLLTNVVLRYSKPTENSET